MDLNNAKIKAQFSEVQLKFFYHPNLDFYKEYTNHSVCKPWATNVGK